MSTPSYTAFDFSDVAGAVTTVLGGIGAGLVAVIAGGLAVRAVTWGFPKIIRFFTKIAR